MAHLPRDKFWAVYACQEIIFVLSTIMMHHLSDSLKRQGLVEIARVLKPAGHLVIADFDRPEERAAQPMRFGAGGSRIQDFTSLVKEAGFSQVKEEEMQLPRFPAHQAGFAGFVSGKKPTS
jgi:SAM-dependent methyltransferase